MKIVRTRSERNISIKIGIRWIVIKPVNYKDMKYNEEID